MARPGLGACGDCLNMDSSGTYCVETDESDCFTVVGPPILPPAGVVGPPILAPVTNSAPPSCPTGQVYGTSGCVADPALAALASIINPSTTSGAPSTSQTFSQWIVANSTLLLVSFGAIGAVMALAGHKR